MESSWEPVGAPHSPADSLVPRSMPVAWSMQDVRSAESPHQQRFSTPATPLPTFATSAATSAHNSSAASPRCCAAGFHDVATCRQGVKPAADHTGTRYESTNFPTTLHRTGHRKHPRHTSNNPPTFSKSAATSAHNSSAASAGCSAAYS